MKEIGVAAGVQENNIAVIDAALPAGAPFSRISAATWRWPSCWA